MIIIIIINIESFFPNQEFCLLWQNDKKVHIIQNEDCRINCLKQYFYFAIFLNIKSDKITKLKCSYY